MIKYAYKQYFLSVFKVKKYLSESVDESIMYFVGSNYNI